MFQMVVYLLVTLITKESFHFLYILKFYFYSLIKSISISFKIICISLFFHKYIFQEAKYPDYLIWHNFHVLEVTENLIFLK